MTEKPRFLSFNPRIGGAPSGDFTYHGSNERTCPMQLPASGEEVIVVRDRPSVVTVLADPRFSLARTDGTSAVTGAVFQSQEGLLRRDPPGLITSGASC